MGQCRVGFDDSAHRYVEGTMTEFGWQLDTKYLEQATDLILQIDAFIQHCPAAGE
jgi:hypothetical protein